MQKFTGNFGYRIPLLLMCALGASMLWLALQVPADRSPARQWLSCVFFGTSGLGMLWYFGWGLLESFTVYQADAEGLQRRAWNGRQHVRWSDLTQVETSGHINDTMELSDNQNQKLSICFSLLSAGNNAALRALLAPHLVPLRERQLREVGRFNTVYHPKRALGFACLLWTLLSGVALMGLCLEPMPPVSDRSQFWAYISLLIMTVGITLPGLIGTLYGYTHVLTITDQEISERSVFGVKSLAYHHITLFVSREVSYKGDQWEVTRLEGGGRKSVLHSKMKDYPLLMEFIRERVDAKIVQQGEVEAQAANRKEQKSAQCIQAVCVPLLSLILLGLGTKGIYDANARLQPYRLLDAQGRPATGTILGKVETGEKNRPYVLRFAFTTADGRRIESASPVLYSDYKQGRVGNSVRVMYVPARPDVCRVAQSNGKRNAIIDMGIGGFVFTGAFLMPALVFWEAHSKRSKSAKDAD